jgi:hypothetical protein
MYYFSTFIEKFSILQELLVNLVQLLKQVFCCWARHYNHKLMMFILYGGNHVGVIFTVVPCILTHTIFYYSSNKSLQSHSVLRSNTHTQTGLD